MAKEMRPMHKLLLPTPARQVHSTVLAHPSWRQKAVLHGFRTDLLMNITEFGNSSPFDTAPHFLVSQHSEMWQIIRLQSCAAMKAEREPGAIHTQFRRSSPPQCNSSPLLLTPHSTQSFLTSQRRLSAPLCLCVCCLFVSKGMVGTRLEQQHGACSWGGEDNEHTGGNPKYELQRRRLQRAHSERAAPPAELCLPACERGRRS